MSNYTFYDLKANSGEMGYTTYEPISDLPSSVPSATATSSVATPVREGNTGLNGDSAVPDNIASAHSSLEDSVYHTYKNPYPKGHPDYQTSLAEKFNEDTKHLLEQQTSILILSGIAGISLSVLVWMMARE